MGIVSTSWGVIVAQHWAQPKVMIGLTTIGVDFFRPVEERLAIVNGRHVRAFQPLLGEYILTSVTAAWRDVMGLKGVDGWLLGVEDYPAQVLPYELGRLRSMCEDGVYKSPTQSKQTRFKYGDKVIVKSGPLAGQTGKFDSANKRGETALFVLFGREQRIRFKVGELLSA